MVRATALSPMHKTYRHTRVPDFLTNKNLTYSCEREKMGSGSMPLIIYLNKFVRVEKYNICLNQLPALPPPLSHYRHNDAA